jgi:hypothetical protein
MRRALSAAVAAAAVLFAVPATAGADPISLGQGLGITWNNGPVLSISVLPTNEAQVLLSDGTSQTCAGAVPLTVSSAGNPSCVATSVIAPSTAAQQASGVAQVSNVGLYFNAQALGMAAATGVVIVINPYTQTAYQVAIAGCSALLGCGQTFNENLYNAGSLPASILSVVSFTNPLQLLPAVQAGASSTEDGTVNGGFGIG